MANRDEIEAILRPKGISYHDRSDWEAGQMGRKANRNGQTQWHSNAIGMLFARFSENHLPEHLKHGVVFIEALNLEKRGDSGEDERKKHQLGKNPVELWVPIQKLWHTLRYRGWIPNWIRTKMINLPGFPAEVDTCHCHHLMYWC